MLIFFGLLIWGDGGGTPAPAVVPTRMTVTSGPTTAMTVTTTPTSPMTVTRSD